MQLTPWRQKRHGRGGQAERPLVRLRDEVQNMFDRFVGSAPEERGLGFFPGETFPRVHLTESDN